MAHWYVICIVWCSPRFKYYKFILPVGPLPVMLIKRGPNKEKRCVGHLHFMMQAKVQIQLIILGHACKFALKCFALKCKYRIGLTPLFWHQVGHRTLDRNNVRRSFLWSDGWADGKRRTKRDIKLHFRVTRNYLPFKIAIFLTVCGQWMIAQMVEQLLCTRRTCVQIPAPAPYEITL